MSKEMVLAGILTCLTAQPCLCGNGVVPITGDRPIPAISSSALPSLQPGVTGSVPVSLTKTPAPNLLAASTALPAVVYAAPVVPVSRAPQISNLAPSALDPAPAPRERESRSEVIPAPSVILASPVTWVVNVPAARYTVEAIASEHSQFLAIIRFHGEKFIVEPGSAIPSREEPALLIRGISADGVDAYDTHAGCVVQRGLDSGATSL